jgi:hypothetical protein
LNSGVKGRGFFSIEMVKNRFFFYLSMNFREEQYNNYKYVIADLNYSSDKDFLENVEKEGKENAEKQNKSNPAGEIREKNKIIFNNVAGVLAEEIVKEYLIKLISDFNINAKIIPTPFIDHATHKDIKIEVNGKIKTIEIRSSFQISPRLTIKGVLTWAFRLLGRYTTNYKKGEEEKDFYVTIIHRYRNEEILTKIKNKVEAYIIGGASKEVFDKIGSDDNSGLKQGKACYRIIKPIISAPKDTPNLFKEILEIKEEEIKQKKLF